MSPFTRSDAKQDTRTSMDSPKLEAIHVEDPDVDLEEALKKGDEEGKKVDHFGTGTDYSPEEKALLRRLDWHIMPIVFCMYYMNKTDQNAIANARLDGLEEDLGLTGNQFNVAVSILYAGYTCVQIPSNLMMSSGKVRPSRWMAGWMLAWAVVSACTAAVNNYTGLVIVRLLLGFTEAPFYPGAIYLLSLFYTRREIALRIGILYTANILATSFAGLIAAATFGTIGGSYGVAGWRWLFIILGIVTVAVAIAAVFLLPDHPLTTRWLTPEQRQLAHDRMERDTVGLEESRGAIAGFKQAITDPKLALFVLFQTLHASLAPCVYMGLIDQMAACGFNSFFPTVVKTLGFSTTVTLVMTCPPYFVAGVFAIFLGWSSGKHNEKSIHISSGMAVALVGFVLAASTLNTAARYIACFLFATGAYSANSIIIGWASATCGQTPEKKAAALSIINTVSMASFIYTPYLYPKTDGPRYLMAMVTNAAFVTAVIVCVWIMRIWLQRKNKQLQRDSADVRLLYAY